MSWHDAVSNLQTTAVRIFGERDSDPILYHPGGSGSFSIEGIYREAGVAVDVNLGVEIRTEAPELHVKLDALLAITGAAALASSDEVTVRGIRRRVSEHIGDGEGVEILILQEG
jgi:hypothetical protein